MTPDVRSSGTLFICLWPMKYGHCETTPRKKWLLATKNNVFYIFVEEIPKKRPSVASKVPRLRVEAPFSPFVLALDNRAACDDLSGLDSSAFRFQV